MYIGVHVKYPLFLPGFIEIWNFLDHLKKTQMSYLMQICPVRAKLFHADGLTDRHDASDSSLSQFRKAP